MNFLDNISRAGKMASHLRVVSASAEDPGEDPSTDMEAHDNLDLKFQRIQHCLLASLGT